jgi:hypothetical protein
MVALSLFLDPFGRGMSLGSLTIGIAGRAVVQAWQRCPPLKPERRSPHEPRSAHKPGSAGNAPT